MNENLSVYNKPDVVEYYGKLGGLLECEKKAFSQYLKKNTAILDLGVGGGRTTIHLSEIASRYLGVDYSEGMVKLCEQRFPKLKFLQADASRMPMLKDGEFDAVVFSFNGIDMLDSDEKRRDCLNECRRVLKPGGTFIFSSHNAKQLVLMPDYRGANTARVVWRSIRAVVKTLQLIKRHLFSSAYWNDGGYIFDPVHGGLHTYLSTPRGFEAQLGAAGFELLETVSGRYPVEASALTTPWYYYVCRKRNA